MLVFIHIPKTGGTSLTTLIHRRYNQILTLSTPKQLQDFRTDKDRIIAETEAVVGHHFFGLHREVSKPCEYVTFLREPLDRIVSDYYYILETQPGNRDELRARIKDEDLDLARFVNDPRYRMSENGMVRFLADHPFWGKAEDPDNWWKTIPHGQLPNEWLSQAKANLERCVYVGFTEHMDAESLSPLQDRFGLSVADIPRANITFRRPSVAELDPLTIKTLEDRHRLDLELYDWALGKFRQTTRSHSPGTLPVAM